MSALSKTPNIAVEICVDSIESGIEAEKAGAARVELCANIFEGGITPSAGCVAIARQKINIPIHVLLRPRGGDFCYTDLEFETMLLDLKIIKEAGCAGVVLGILKSDGNVDMARTAILIQAARPMTVTFHRAFDMTSNPVLALQDLIKLGVDRLLTSGQENTALEGAELIKDLIRNAAGKIMIMPGGGITERNISRVQRETGAQEFHLSARKKIPGTMQYQNERVSMGGVLRLPEYERAVADGNRIIQVMAAVGSIKNI